MSDYGIKISKPGKNVINAGLKDLLFHSKYPLLKLVKSGSGSITFTDGGAGFDGLIYTHNLGYAPMFFLFSQWYDPFLNTVKTEYRRMPLSERSAGGLISQKYTPLVNNTEFRYSGFTMGGDGASHTINFYWFLYYDPQ